MKIAFWSENRREGTTASMMAIAAAVAWKMRVSCLLTQIYSPAKDLEELFMHKTSEDERGCIRLEMGTDQLIRQFKSGKLTPDDILNNTIEKDGRLAFLIPPSRTDGISIDRSLLKRILPIIYSAAERAYEAVMIDAGYGLSEDTVSILKESDTVAVVCHQGRKTVSRIMDRMIKAGIKENRLFFLFSKYLSASRYSINNIRFLEEGLININAGSVPLSAAFMDAIEDGHQESFLKNLKKKTKETEDPYFYSEVSKSAEKLIELSKRIVRRR